MNQEVHLLYDKDGETQGVMDCPQDPSHGLYSWDISLVTCPSCLSHKDADDFHTSYVKHQAAFMGRKLQDLMIKAAKGA